MRNLCICVLCITSLSGIAQTSTPLAITIDDLPGLRGEEFHEVNKVMVEVLTTNQWPATAFVNENGFYRDGKLDSSSYRILHMWLSNGIELGNHSFSHLNYHNTDTLTYFKDILAGGKLSKDASKEYNLPFRYFRHPYLRNGQTIEKKSALTRFLSENGYDVAPVTIDNSEWIFASAYSKAINRNDPEMSDRIGRAYIKYMLEISNYYRCQAKTLTGRDIGHVLLIHVRQLNADWLEPLIKALEQQGFAIKPLEVVLRDPVYEREDGYFGPAGISWVDRWAHAKGVSSDFFNGFPSCPQFVQEYAGINE